MKRVRKGNNEDGVSYWQSYSDMMSALLLVFALIIAFTVFRAKAAYNEREQRLEEQRQKLAQQEKDIRHFKEQAKRQGEQIDKIIGVRSEIVKQLKEEFRDSDLEMAIDADTGTICFDSNVLFRYDDSTLRAQGTEFLNEFFPKYFEVILDRKLKAYISEVIIEGHTDNNGSYIYNLGLSQRRAYAVAQYCLGESSHMFSAKKLEQVRQIVTANGRAYYGLKYKTNGEVDAKASRRVEIKFRLSEEDMMGEISSLLDVEG